MWLGLSSVLAGVASPKSHEVEATDPSRSPTFAVKVQLPSVSQVAEAIDACGRLFTGGAQPNRGCADAAALLATDDAGALARLKEAGYR